jgi:hypothetical protein
MGISVSLNGSQQLGKLQDKQRTDPIWSGAGGANYSHRNPFSISNLVYSASIQLNTFQGNQRVLTGDPNALSWQTGAVFQQSVDYRIGRLNFRGTNTLNEIDGKKNVAIFGTVSRTFGGY